MADGILIRQFRREGHELKQAKGPQEPGRRGGDGRQKMSYELLVLIILHMLLCDMCLCVLLVMLLCYRRASALCVLCYVV